MKVIKTIAAMRQVWREARGKTIGLVPTMGYLHEGHLSLVKRAKSECEIVVMSIFVNPLQFGPNEDFDRYPRDFARDRRLAEEAGVDYLFYPEKEEMFPEEPLTHVKVDRVSEPLCGASRPGHFTGVATIVCKLFHIVMPDRAYFGLKDAQQVAVIQQMVKDLNFPITIVPCETVREADGLAKSSRNVYLSAEERKQATILYQALSEAKEKLSKGVFRNVGEVRQYLSERISSMSLAEIDYVDVLTYPALRPPASLQDVPLILAVAVRFGKARLIDNMIWEGSLLQH